MHYVKQEGNFVFVRKGKGGWKDRNKLNCLITMLIDMGKIRRRLSIELCEREIGSPVLYLLDLYYIHTYTYIRNTYV